MDRRRDAATEFYQAVLDSDERPFVVTDEATVFDISGLDERELRRRITSVYYVSATVDLHMPFWRLLDELVTAGRQVRRD